LQFSENGFTSTALYSIPQLESEYIVENPHNSFGEFATGSYVGAPFSLEGGADQSDTWLPVYTKQKNKYVLLGFAPINSVEEVLTYSKLYKIEVLSNNVNQTPTLNNSVEISPFGATVFGRPSFISLNEIDLYINAANQLVGTQADGRGPGGVSCNAQNRFVLFLTEPSIDLSSYNIHSYGGFAFCGSFDSNGVTSFHGGSELMVIVTGKNGSYGKAWILGTIGHEEGHLEGGDHEGGVIGGVTDNVNIVGDLLQGLSQNNLSVSYCNLRPADQYELCLRAQRLLSEG
jgi:hypothetical protein